MSVTFKFVLLVCSLILAVPSDAQFRRRPGGPPRLPLPPISFDFAGAVYVNTNDFDENAVMAFGRLPNGTLLSIGSFPTGGKGAAVDEMDGIDPLFSAFALFVTPDNRFVIAVNAGSRSVTVFLVQRDFTLKRASVTRVPGFGPASIAFSNGIVYVASLEAGRRLPQGFTIFGLMGSLSGFRLSASGQLTLIPGSVRKLNNRPSAIRFSPDGRTLLVTSVAAGSEELDTDVVEELVSFRVLRGGLLSKMPVSVVTSTELDNPEGRNLPAAIGMDTARIGGVQYVVVGEPRSIAPDGGAGPLQTSSVSIWKITPSSQLIPSQLDVLVGSSVTMGQETTCWVEFSRSENIFWVANTISGTISAFSFRGGRAVLIDEVAGLAEVPIDLWLSSDGKFLYQLSPGSIAAFSVGRNGLTAIQTVTDIPEENVQGIVAI